MRNVIPALIVVSIVFAAAMVVGVLRKNFSFASD
jgi:hypothetical protein